MEDGSMMYLFFTWHIEAQLVLRSYIWTAFQVAFLSTNSTLKFVLHSVRTLMLISKIYQQDHFLILLACCFLNRTINISIFKKKVSKIPHKCPQNIIQKTQKKMQIYESHVNHFSVDLSTFSDSSLIFEHKC